MMAWTGFLSGRSFASGQAAIFAFIAFGVISAGGIGPMIPYRFRVGIMYTATEWVMVRACSADLWQFRSTSTTSSLRDPAKEDDLVCRGRTVRDKIGHVGAEHFCCVPFGLADRARMVKERPEFPHRDGEIGAEELLAKEIIEQPSCR